MRYSYKILILAGVIISMNIGIIFTMVTTMMTTGIETNSGPVKTIGGLFCCGNFLSIIGILYVIIATITLTSRYLGNEPYEGETVTRLDILILMISCIICLPAAVPCVLYAVMAQ